MLMQAFILIGVSGSGKSTAANELAKRLKDTDPTRDTVIFSLDVCRLHFYAKYAKTVSKLCYDAAYTFVTAYENRDAFWQYVKETWDELLPRGANVIVDNVNADDRDRWRWLNDFEQKGYDITFVIMTTPLEVALARQLTRPDKRVADAVVYRQYLKIEFPQISDRYRIKELDGTKPMPELFHISRRSAIIT